MKNSKGITLIALIITIIVMLILAGVSISMVVGENGIIIRAQNAIREYQIAGIKERLVTDLNYRYKNIVGRTMEEQTMRAIAELSLDYDIPLEKFSVHYKEYSDPTKSVEIILLRNDMDIEEEKNKLTIVEYYGEKNLLDENNNYILDANGRRVKNKNIKDNIIISKGDYDGDGFITYIEQEKIVNILRGTLNDGEKEIECFDYTGDGCVNVSDLSKFNSKYGTIGNDEIEVDEE